MRRAIFLACGERLHPAPLAREFDVIPARFPPGRLRALQSWQAFADRLDVELSASWLLFPAAEREMPAAVLGAFRGCRAVGSAAELARAVRMADRAAARSRVLTDFQTVGRRCDLMRKAGRRIVFTNGVFDLFHLGHLRLLQAARALGDALVVGINSDDSARRLKGRRRPVVPQFARAEIVAAVRGVDFCAIFGQADPRELLRAVRPHVLAKGSEYTLAGVVGRRMVEARGGRTVLVPHLGGWSSTEMMEKIRSMRS